MARRLFAAVSPRFLLLAVVVCATSGGVSAQEECPCMTAMGFSGYEVTSGSLAASWGVEAFTKWTIDVKASATTGTMAAYTAACTAIGGACTTSVCSTIYELQKDSATRTNYKKILLPDAVHICVFLC